MKNSYRVWLVGLTLGFAWWGCSASADDVAPAGEGSAAAVAAKPQTTCPVMAGNAINKKYFVDYNGKRIYFCCGACPKLFTKDPGKYMKVLEEAGITLEDAPAAAPESSAGKEADHSGHPH